MGRWGNLLYGMRVLCVSNSLDGDDVFSFNYPLIYLSNVKGTGNQRCKTCIDSKMPKHN